MANHMLLLLLALAAAGAAAAPARVRLPFKGAKLTFALIGDWGRIGGEYSDGTLATCKKLAAQFVANPNLPEGDDPEGNSCGGLEQLKVAALMNKVCKARGCNFVVNTGDNFYTNGCYADTNTGVAPKLRCAQRFKSDWEQVYNSPDMHALRNLPWISSLGNHDVLGLASGVDAQIAYSSKNPNWILPARWYNADVVATSPKGVTTSIRVHVAHTSCFIKKYRKSDSPYNLDENIACSNATNVAAQLAFLESSLSDSKADWDIVLAHHPGVSAAGPSYFDPAQKPSSGTDGWGPLAALVSKYSPVAYFNGHDHAMSFQYAPEPAVSGDTTLAAGWNRTGFYTSGAGSWPQAADGGFGLDYPYSFTKYSNADMLQGLGRSGFAIVTVDAANFVVDYYSVNNGMTVPLRVTTAKGKMPVWQVAPQGLVAVNLPNSIQMNADGEFVQFRKKV